MWACEAVKECFTGFKVNSLGRVEQRPLRQTCCSIRGSGVDGLDIGMR